MEAKKVLEVKQALINTLATVKGVKLKNESDSVYFEFDKTADLSAQILPNFKLGEFLTKNKKDTFTRIQTDIAAEAQVLRDLWGSGIKFNSTYRSPSYNASVGGAKASQHLYGRALDTKPVNGDIAGYKKFVKANKLTGGVGLYPTFVHIDTGRTRYW